MTRGLFRAAPLIAVLSLALSCSWLEEEDAELAAGLERGVFAEGLEFPVAMALTPNGHVLVTEKESGDVRWIDKDGGLRKEPVIHFDVASEGEWGLLGIALDPDFDTNQLVYVYYMEPEQDGRSQPVIARFRLADERGEEPEIIVDNLPRTALSAGSPDVDLFSNIHVGGNIHFGPDGLLYVAVGDFGVFEERAADPSELTGKILRFTADGEPAPGSVPRAGADPRVFAYGLRNPFDFDWDAGGRLVAVDNGPEACDEINIVREGGHYGWPSPRVSRDSCERRDGESAIAYLAREGTEPNENDSTVGPSSLLYLADGLGQFDGPGVVVCEVNTGRLRYLALEDDSLDVDDGVTLAGDCFTDVIQLADGSLLYATSEAIHRISTGD